MLHNVKPPKAETRRRPTGRWGTVLTRAAHKRYADGQGTEAEAPLDEHIELCAFAMMPGLGAFAADKVLALQRRPIRTGVQTDWLLSSKRAAFAGADPYNVRIDRNPHDNVIATTGG